MAKPASLPVWATDTNLASGSQSGNSTKLEPSAGYKAQGTVPGKSLPGRFYNWLFNLQYQWCVYLDNLPNESAFLGAEFVWTDEHNFSGTARVATSLGLYSGAEATYTDSTGAPSPRAFTIMVPILQNTGDASVDGWAQPPNLPGDAYLVCTVTDAQRKIPIDTNLLPTGAIITSVRASMRQGGAAANDMFLRAYKAVAGKGGGGSLTTTQLGATGTHTGAAATTEIVSTGAFSEAVDRSVTNYYAVIAASSNAATNTDQLNWIEVNGTIPGPRSK